MSVINTNVKSLVAQQSLGMNERNMSTVMERLSTGNRINSARDDAAGLSIASRMDSQIRGLNMAIRNANDGVSLLQTAEGAMQEVTNMLQRMRELSVQSVNAVNNGSDRATLDAEVQQLKAEIDRISKTTQFNGINILDGTFNNKTLQIGDNQGETLNVSIGGVGASQLGMDASRFGGDVLVGARIGDLAALNFNEGDIRINGQDLKEFIGAEEGDIGGLVANINRSVDNVVASAFNTVVAKEKGDGKVSAGELTIKVQPLRTDKGPGTAAPAEVVFEIGASESMEELVANINAQTAGLVKASLNDEGKLVLSNDTGATIKVEDTSAPNDYDGGSGFSLNEQTYRGFLKLESTDGNPIRIERGNLYDFDASGTQDNLNELGFNSIGGITDNDAYTITGRQVTAPTQEWEKDELIINGVVIYDKDIDTDTFEGKLNVINAFSAQTGVKASAYFEKSFDMDPTETFEASDWDTTDQVFFNGVGVTVGADLEAFVDNINDETALTGLTAEARGNTLILKGDNIQVVNIDLRNADNDDDAAGEAELGFAFTAGPEYGRIRLDSVNNTPISIQLGEDVLSTPGNVDAGHGFMQTNVGAADYDKNAPTLGVGGSGSTLSGLNIASEGAATKAIGVIDNGLQRVNDIRAELGAVQNRLESTINNLSKVVTNTSASQSRIRDTDYAVETTNLARAQIVQQAATAMLAQANQQPSTVLALLQ